jgi:hypothetical protein
MSRRERGHLHFDWYEALLLIELVSVLEQAWELKKKTNVNTAGGVYQTGPTATNSFAESITIHEN